jgi:streptogramin lyase
LTAGIIPTGPCGIRATPKGDIWYRSLADSFIAQIDAASAVDLRQSRSPCAA